MQNDYLFSLYCHCMETVERPRKLELQRAEANFDQLEKKFEQTMGIKFVQQYQDAWIETSSWQEEAAFWAGVRLGMNLTLTALS